MLALMREGGIKPMTYQIAPVEKPLNAVVDMVKCKHTVVFDDEGSFIRDKTTGDINWLREDNGNYMLDVWILPPDATNQIYNETGMNNNNNMGSFPRQLP